MQLFRAANLYADYDPTVPVYRVTPHREPAVHRFFDTCPTSPSGRYLAVTTLPFQWRRPAPGTKAAVDVIDLETGERVFRAITAAWDQDLGAQVQWGASDRDLFFNDMDLKTWMPFGLHVDPLIDRSVRLDGPVYMVSPDGRYSITPCLRRMTLVQPGHGVVVPKLEGLRQDGASAEDGVFGTDHQTGRTGVLVSFADVASAAPDVFARYRGKAGGFYGAHAQWNPQQTRILFVMRWLPSGPRAVPDDPVLVTFDTDGRNIRVALDARHWPGGNGFAAWARDGEHIVTTSLSRRGDPVLRALDGFLGASSRLVRDRIGIDPAYQSRLSVPRFTSVRFDGAQRRFLAPDLIGSGRPTLGPDDRVLLADSDPDDSLSTGDGTGLIRLVDLKRGVDHQVVRMRMGAGTTRSGASFHPSHPVWDRTGDHVVFKGCPHGIRQVFIADMRRVLAERHDVKARSWM
ncbi:MAG: hypothetical protein ACFB6R_01165 [Alphaproteobacteria bacterium]